MPHSKQNGREVESRWNGERAHKTYQLVIFAQDGHPVSFHWRERDRQTIAWFRQHMR